MTTEQICAHMRNSKTTKDHYLDAVRKLRNVNLLPKTDAEPLTARQCAWIIYVSAGTTAVNRNAAIYLISKDEPTALCHDVGESIVDWLEWLIKDTWRPFGFVDSIAFNRGTGTAMNINETDKEFTRIFTGCLPVVDSDEVLNDLTGLDMTLIAAEFCGDRVGR